MNDETTGPATDGARPLSAEHLVCPFDVDSRLRAEAPVYHEPVDDIWVVSRYDDVQDALRRPEVFSNRFGRIIRSRDRLPAEALEILAEGWAPVDTLFTTDPPEHRRFRSLVSKAFTPRRVDGMAAGIDETARTLLADVLSAASPVDIVSAYAAPLPMIVIADQLGVSRDDLALFSQWSRAVVNELSRLATPEQQIDAARACVAFQHYFHERIGERRSVPADDMLSDLVHAETVDDRPLDDAELLMMLQQLLVAGNETTTNGIASGIWRLATDGDLQRDLRAEPASLEGFVEEILRLEAPIQGMWRVMAAEATLGGVTIPEGAVVMLRYGSANRDEGHYDAPAHLDPVRANPRDHLAFGGGLHFCIGAALARSEMQIAFARLLEATSRIALAPGVEVEHGPHLLIRGIDSLPVVLEVA
ncbi:MAG: cytochrome P450 [Acidimicrobiales bacterium]